MREGLQRPGCKVEHLVGQYGVLVLTMCCKAEQFVHDGECHLHVCHERK